MSIDRLPGPEISYSFTVFTPTYNRAHTLHRVFESLEKQTFRDFEWLIVDDGSTDQTASLVAGWQEAAAFPIWYVRQENQGKHIAINKGVKIAKGELFLIVDSDDALVATALETLWSYWSSIPADKKADFNSISARCIDQFGRPLGPELPGKVFDSDMVSIYMLHGLRVERCLAIVTEILRKFPFRDDIQKCFVPESLVWWHMAEHYKTRFINEALRIYFIKDQISITNPKHLTIMQVRAAMLWHIAFLNKYFQARYLWHSPQEFLRMAVHYVRFSFHTRTHPCLQLATLEHIGAKIFWLVALPLGYFLYHLDRSKGLLRENNTPQPD
jgi:glycosyltransferase involved in cell wall biosynthesis